MSDAVAGEVLCEEVLALTSACRCALLRLQENQTDSALRAAVLDASQALHGCLSQSPLEPLSPYSEALWRLAKVWDVQPGPLDGLAAAVGIVEQSFDGFVEGVSPEGLRGLYEELRRAVPSQWQGYVDCDGAAFEARLLALQENAPATAAAALPESPEQAFQRELRATFLAEADEAFALCEELLVQLEQRADDREVLDALFRQFHTLKGGAAAVDLPEAAAQLHSGESILQATRDATAVVDGVALIDFLLRLTDSVRGVIDRSCGRADSPYVVIADVEREIAALNASVSVGAASPDTPAASEAEVRGQSIAPPDGAAAGAPVPDPVVLGSQLHALTELRERLGRGEGAGDIRLFIDALDRQAQQFWELASELKEQVNSLVLVPLEQVFRRLQRPARDAARQEGKLVTLELSGGEMRVDRTIAERLHGSLLHLVRNAVSHGIEPPAARELAGKHRTGIVRVRAEQLDRDLRLVVEDDGSGLDLAAIRAKAEALGWISPQAPPDRAVLIRLILRSGFSTRAAVTDLAGRGVGMDVVARDVEALAGSIDIESEAGRGTRIGLSIPLDKADPSATRSSTVPPSSSPRSVG